MPASASKLVPYWPAAVFDSLIADANALLEPKGLVDTEPLGALLLSAVPLPDGEAPTAELEPPNDSKAVGAAPPRPTKLGAHDIDACGFDWAIREPEKPCAPLESLTASDLRGC
jgi:hypothetical protein